VSSAVWKEDEDPAAPADIGHAIREDGPDFVFSHGSASESGAYHGLGHTPLNALNAPSTGTTMPVTNRAPGPHSQAAVRARSSATPNRPAGVCF
jgi:hypothetical protein